MIAPWGFISRYPQYMPVYPYPYSPSPYSYLYPWRGCSGQPWMTYPMMPPKEKYYQTKEVVKTSQTDPWIQAYQEMVAEKNAGISEDLDT